MSASSLREAAVAAGLDGLAELLARGETAWIVVATASMAPVLLPGDEILVEPFEGPPRMGDCIVWRDGSTLVVHRFLLARATGLVTMGDGGNRVDGPLARNRVLGRVRARRREGRTTPWRPWAARLRALSSLVRLALRRLRRGRSDER